LLRVRKRMGVWLSGSSTSLSTVGILGQIVTSVGTDRHIRRGGRGAEWSGDACVAHGGQGQSGRGTGAFGLQKSHASPLDKFQTFVYTLCNRLRNTLTVAVVAPSR
jgi:hypothetical protein